MVFVIQIYFAGRYKCGCAATIHLRSTTRPALLIAQRPLVEQSATSRTAGALCHYQTQVVEGASDYEGATNGSAFGRLATIAVSSALRRWKVVFASCIRHPRSAPCLAVFWLCPCAKHTRTLDVAKNDKCDGGVFRCVPILCGLTFCISSQSSEDGGWTLPPVLRTICKSLCCKYVAPRVLDQNTHHLSLPSNCFCLEPKL